MKILGALLLLLVLVDSARAQAPPPSPTLEQRLLDRLLSDIDNYVSAYTQLAKQDQERAVGLAAWWGSYVKGLEGEKK